MSTKLSNILKLTTLGITLLFTSEYAYSENVMCANVNWGQTCGRTELFCDPEYGCEDAGVLWTTRDKCTLVIDPKKYFPPNLGFKIFEHPECEFGHTKSKQIKKQPISKK